MKKTKPYTPIYADILDKSSPEPPSSKVKGVSYLPSEIEANAKEFERRRQIRAERTVVVLLSIAVILMGMALSLFGILEVLVGLCRRDSDRLPGHPAPPRPPSLQRIFPRDMCCHHGMAALPDFNGR